MPASEPDLASRRYELWRCPGCGCAVTGGEPAPELHEQGAFRPARPRLHRVAGPALRAFDHQRLTLLGQVALPGARILDAGAGRGRFVLRARAAGYDAMGIDPYRGLAERGDAPGCGCGGGEATVLAASIEEASIPARSLGAVTLWHVLEHLENPRAALERIAGWLVPGGGLVVGVPNLASLQARIGGERWYHLDVPRHRSHFTPAGLSQLLNDTGFQVAAIEHRLLEHNPFGMWQTVLNRVSSEPSWLYNVLKRNARLSARELALTALAIPLMPLAAAVELAAGQAHRGGTIAVLARRRGAGEQAG
ncbi:MAG: class I SAM-dependent methyltransferase [Solirubrobacteraceae bacterium]